MVSVPGEASGHTGLFSYSNSYSKMKGKNACLLSFCIYVFFFFYQIVSK